MKYIGMPMWMWVLFSKSFRDKLISVFGYGAGEAGKISKAAEARYRAIIAGLTKCGICTLMKELGLQEYIAAMCRLDYPMTEAGRSSDFIREYTLASGGPYCDCGYRKKAK